MEPRLFVRVQRPVRVHQLPEDPADSTTVEGAVLHHEGVHVVSEAPPKRLARVPLPHPHREQRVPQGAIRLDPLAAQPGVERPKQVAEVDVTHRGPPTVGGLEGRRLGGDLHEGEAAPHRDVEQADAAVGGVHGAEQTEVGGGW